MRQQIKVTFHFSRNNTIKVQGPVEQPQGIKDAGKRGPRDETRFYFFHHLLKKNIQKRFYAETEAEGIEFQFMITPVHGGNINGEMSFSIDIFTNIKSFRGKDETLELFKIAEQLEDLLPRVFLKKGLFEPPEFRKP